jgi:hypothetical protein
MLDENIIIIMARTRKHEGIRAKTLVAFWTVVMAAGENNWTRALPFCGD